MAEKLIQTLFGEEWIELAPTCKVEGCNKPADNAGNGRYHELLLDFVDRLVYNTEYEKN